MENKTNEYYKIDLLHIVKALWHRAWLIALVALLAAAIGFSVAAFAITPTYSSTIMLYVNNTSSSSGGSISSSQIVAAQSLVKTYGEILDNRTTLEKVIEKAEVDYTYKQLSSMIVSAPANDTEIMKVTVTTTNADEAAKIANCIAEVLPMRIKEIIDGASMEVVEYAVPNYDKTAPSITRYTAVGFALGLLLIVAILTVVAMMDDVIHDEEYVIQTYDCPVLAKIPELTGNDSRRYGYYYYRYRRRSRDVAPYAGETNETNN